MKPARNYVSAAAFRTALEVRLKKLAMEEGVDLQRVRRQVAFDRLLCRLFALPDAPWVLKGGYAMELRVKTARTTRDIDLALKQLLSLSASWEANAGTVLGMLREAAGTGSRDHFTFLIGEAVQDLDAAPYGGARFPVEARLAGRAFVKFHLDVSTGDVLHEPYQLLRGRDWLGFAGIAAAQFPAISSEEQFAEKVHALAAFERILFHKFPDRPLLYRDLFKRRDVELDVKVPGIRYDRAVLHRLKMLFPLRVQRPAS